LSLLYNHNDNVWKKRTEQRGTTLLGNELL